MKMYDPHNKSIKNNNIDYDKTLALIFQVVDLNKSIHL